MAVYITRRIIQTIGLLFLLSILLFGLVNLAPGGPLAGQGQSRHIAPEKAALLKRQFGLDKPLPVQYVIWLVGNDWMKVDTTGDGIPDGYGTRRGILRGDFGFSFRTRQPVLDEISLRLPNTIYLMSITFILALVLAIPIGILSATRQYSIFDLIATTFSFAGQALPEFWLGLLMILIFYAWLKNPVTGAALSPIRRHLLTARLRAFRSHQPSCPAGGDRRAGLDRLVFTLSALEHPRDPATGLSANGAGQRCT